MLWKACSKHLCIKYTPWSGNCHTGFLVVGYPLVSFFTGVRALLLSYIPIFATLASSEELLWFFALCCFFSGPNPFNLNTSFLAGPSDRVCQPREPLATRWHSLALHQRPPVQKVEKGILKPEKVAHCSSITRPFQLKSNTSLKNPKPNPTQKTFKNDAFKNDTLDPS